MGILLQFLVLAFTALVWWLARRDLTAQAAEARSPAKDELERLRATIEELTLNLEQRAEAAENRMTRHISELNALMGNQPTETVKQIEPIPETVIDERYAKISGLVAAGVTDSTEIARQTGLGRGEVELILSLRARHVL